MTLKVKVVKANGSAIGATACVTVISEDSFSTNLFDAAELPLYSQFVQYEPYHGLKCFINTLSNYVKEAKLGQLITKITLPVDGEGVADILAFKTLITNIRQLEFIRHPQLSPFNQEKHVSQGVSLGLMF